MLAPWCTVAVIAATSALAPSGPTVARASTAGADAHPRWGRLGHELAARAAHLTLPDDVPAFFMDAREELVHLGPEPDRWRDRRATEMDQAWSHDHFVNLERVPSSALDAPDRFAYLDALHEAGLERPARAAGLLPFRIVEIYQRLVTEWRLWRAELDPERRAWIEQRIVHDAGILGHYVSDASQPQHTTIHYDGWANGVPNPAGYTSERGFHARFESDYVEAHVTLADVSRRVPRRPRSVTGTARSAILDLVHDSHRAVEALHRLDRDTGFDPGRPLRSAARDFAAERLAAGASLLATLWWSAWEESGR